MARSTFYYHIKKSRNKDKYGELKEVISVIYYQNKGRYGYRRITSELRSEGYIINHKTVLNLMNLCGLKCQVRLRKYHSYRDEVGKIAPNLLQRDFQTNKPNQKWATDVTEFSIAGKKLYLSPIIDLFNGEIVSYNIAERATFHQTMDMIKKAFAKIPDHTNLILHSDQGWQYQMKQYQHQYKTKYVQKR